MQDALPPDVPLRAKVVVERVLLAVISPEVCNVLEAFKVPPTTKSLPLTVEEALDINPPFKNRVVEKVEEAEETNPPVKRPVPVILRFAEAVEEATET